MKKSRYTEEQIIGTWKRMEAGQKPKELARELGVSEATLYAWRNKYGGLCAPAAVRRYLEGDPVRAGLAESAEAYSARSG